MEIAYKLLMELLAIKNLNPIVVKDNKNGSRVLVDFTLLYDMRDKFHETFSLMTIYNNIDNTLFCEIYVNKDTRINYSFNNNTLLHEILLIDTEEEEIILCYSISDTDVLGSTMKNPKFMSSPKSANTLEDALNSI